jgi:hypothetical protein
MLYSLSLWQLSVDLFLDQSKFITRIEMPGYRNVNPIGF